MTWPQNRSNDRGKPEARRHLNGRYKGRISRAQLQSKPSLCPLDHPQRQNEAADAALEFVTLGTSWQVVLQDNGSAEVRFANEAPVMVNLGPKAPAGRRERAILSLLDAKRDAPDLFGAEFAQWAHRIATGVSIAPVM